jgi:ketosteroid isomerase-like protein
MAVDSALPASSHSAAGTNRTPDEEDAVAADVDANGRFAIFETMEDRVSAEVIASYFQHLNGDEPDLLSALWAPDGKLLPVGARPRVGRDEVRDYYERLFTPWQTHLDSPTRIFSGPPGATVVEVVFTGRAGNGVDVEFDAIDVFDIRDGQIVRLRTLYDLVHVRKSLE